MKVKVFNRTKYNRMLEALERRKAPNYIIEAYHLGYSNVVNLYYREKINKKRGVPSLITESTHNNYLKLMEKDNRRFIQEARKYKDTDFMKLFYQVTNMDILTGEKQPPSAGKLLKQMPTKGLGVNDVLGRKRK